MLRYVGLRLSAMAHSRSAIGSRSPMLHGCTVRPQSICLYLLAFSAVIIIARYQYQCHTTVASRSWQQPVQLSGVDASQLAQQASDANRAGKTVYRYLCRVK